MFNMEVCMKVLTNKKFILYVLLALISSGLNVGIYFISYNYLLKSVLFSNFLAYGISISVSFYLNKRYVYKSKSKNYKKMVSLYLGSKVLSYILDSIVLIVLNALFQKYTIINKLISNASTCVLNYFIGDKIFEN